MFIQLLNYDRILSRRSRVQSVKEEGGSIFVRFYDFEPRRIRFNALTLRRSGNNFQHAIESVDLRPIGRAELAQSLSAAGFQGVRMFGNAKLEVFDPDTSSDLFVVAMKYAST